MTDPLVSVDPPHAVSAPVFWPSEATLQEREWWGTGAWEDGPTFGQLVEAVRPALRAALLLGWECDAIALGFGAGVSMEGEWQLIRRGTLEMDPGPGLSVDKQAKGPTVWLELTAVGDMYELFGDEVQADGGVGESPVDDELLDDITGTCAIEFDFGLFGSDSYTDDGSVPDAISVAVSAAVDRAVQALTPRIPTVQAWNDAGQRLVREVNGGLLWILDPHYWEGLGTGAEEGELSPVAAELVPVVRELVGAQDGFLRGQLFADRALHHSADGPGPANLRFLLGRARLLWSGQAHTRFWNGLLAELQAWGESHRLWERERCRFTSDDGPSWLDVLGELFGRGVIRSFGLFEPGEPPAPLAATAPSDSAETQVVLTVWGGATITLRRETVFADQPNEGLTGSAAWDYTPGAPQVKPTVILVAGRGVAIEHRIDDLADRPWALEIFRVQDDRLVPRPGAQIDPTRLLSTTQIEPQPAECVFDPADAVTPDAALFPQVMVKPKPDGVTLVYPVSQGVIPDEPFGPFEGQVVPSVIELTVDPLSGTAAYAIDAHYYTDLHMNVPSGEAFNGGVHVSVWTTGDVSVVSFESGNDTPAAGNPSGVTRHVAGHLFVAEFWGVEAEGLGIRQPHPLPRPWSVELPTTRWEDLFPTTFWEAVLQEMWDRLVLQQIQDLFSPDRENPFEGENVPHLVYDHDTRQGTWHDPVSNVDWLLTPKAHRHGDFGAMDSLFFDLVDVAVGFVPFVGDAADIGELAYAWQAGRDRWGRPLTNFQLGIMMAGSALPFVSSAFVRGAAQFLQDLPEMVPGALRFRLLTPASWRNEVPVAEVEAALAQPSVLHKATLAAGSRRRQETTANLVRRFAEDSALETGSMAGALARSLIDGTKDGWLTVDDFISDDGVGFTISSLQTAYTRFLRDNPGMSPLRWIGDGG